MLVRRHDDRAVDGGLVQRPYAKLDPSLGKLIMDFHMIPLYAVFDNLKQHAPQEAERLGIK